MSLILDALRRAEAGRTRDLGARLAQRLPPHARRRKRRGMSFALFALVTVVVAALWHFRQVPIPAPEVVETPSPIAAPSVPARGSSLAEIAIPMPPETPETPEPVAPLLSQLPPEIRDAVPAFTVNAHFWSADPARRFVVIDMQRLRSGDTASDGLRVADIARNGVVFEWRGTRFLVPAQ